MNSYGACAVGRSGASCLCTGVWEAGVRGCQSLSLVTNRAQQIVPPCPIGLSFHAFRRTAVNDAQDPSALLALGNDNLDAVGGCAENGTNLGNVTNNCARH